MMHAKRPSSIIHAKRAFIIFILVLLTACAPETTVQVTPRLLNIYVTSAAYPRVSDLYACAPPAVVVGLSDPASAELTLRLGEPANLSTPAFEVGTDDLLVVNHPQAGVGPLTLGQVRDLFSGQVSNWKDIGGNDLPVQVWTYAQDEDIQQVFDRVAMQGEPITSLARLAASSQGMSDSVGNTPGSIGFLARRWKAGNTREALKLTAVPVLVIARSQPESAARDLIACLQAKP